MLLEEFSCRSTDTFFVWNVLRKRLIGIYNYCVKNVRLIQECLSQFMFITLAVLVGVREPTEVFLKSFIGTFSDEEFSLDRVGLRGDVLGSWLRILSTVVWSSSFVVLLTRLTRRRKRSTFDMELKMAQWVVWFRTSLALEFDAQ